jgi:DNA-binding PadR family transcriptional regulator
MSQISLYALGLLRRHGPQHGYQLKKLIEEQLADFAEIKLPSLYYHLARLEKAMLVSAGKGRRDNRPEKTVFAITKEGDDAFAALLEAALASDYRPVFALDAGLYFKGTQDSARLASVFATHIHRMTMRLRTLAVHRNRCLRTVPETSRAAASLILSHHEHHYEAELRWAQRALAELGVASAAEAETNGSDPGSQP